MEMTPLTFPRMCSPNRWLLLPPFSSSSSPSLSLALLHYFISSKYPSQVSLRVFIRMSWNRQNCSTDEEETEPHEISAICWRSSDSLENQNLNPGVLTFSAYPGSFYSNPQPWALGCQELLGLGALLQAQLLLPCVVIPGAPCAEEFRTRCGYLWSTLSLGDGGLHSSEKAALAHTDYTAQGY